MVESTTKVESMSSYEKKKTSPVMNLRLHTHKLALDCQIKATFNTAWP